MTTVSSPHNARVAAARKLRDSRARAAARLFLAEGPHATEAALAAPRFGVAELFVADTAVDRHADLLRTADAAGVPIVVVTERVAASLSDTVTPQGVVAVVRRPSVDAAAVLAGARLVVVLDRAGDPGNVGTVLRTADAAGADAVVLTAGSVDPYNGKCVRSSAGSVFHVPVVTGSSAPDVLAALASAGLATIATVLDATEDLDDLLDGGALAAPTAWLLGNEAHGLGADLVARVDRRVRIPMYGGAESLNLASAAAVCLYASARALRRPSS